MIACITVALLMLHNSYKILVFQVSFTSSLFQHEKISYYKRKR